MSEFDIPRERQGGVGPAIRGSMHDSIGRKFRDIITGFVGTATGRVEYLTGCNQILLSPEVGQDGSLKETNWFDEQRLVLVSDEKLTLNNGPSPGFDKAAPKI